MSRRFYSSTAITGDRAALAGGEAHHLVHVLRAKAGDEVVLFDGSVAEFLARIERIAKDRVELVVVERREIDRELPFRLTLAVALPKGDRQRWLVEKAVEIGVTQLVPLATTRGVADGGGALDRLRRAVVEASKQCGRNRLMQISPVRPWTELAADANHPSATRLLAHPGGGSATAGNLVRSADDSPTGDGEHVVIAIGPEGGWTDEEAELARQFSWQFVDLGPRVLRVETAAIALSSVEIARRTRG